MPLNEIGAGAGPQARTQNLMLLTRFGRPAESEPNLGRDSKPYALVNEIRLASRARAELGHTAGQGPARAQWGPIKGNPFTV